MTEKQNNIIEGVLIGIVATMILMFLLKDNKEPTWWCAYLSQSEANYCYHLYDKAVNIIDNIPEEEMPPMPL
ncbi:MAG: hypothetical protein PHS54_05430 [Clostridia bacterium]|jgi:hypothetical protein|nr:hypothetical protein [Clostridia bacterium]